MTPDAAPVAALAEAGSTNDEAMARLRASGTPLWLTAARQTAGRGRRGRPWSSEPGNLYASYAFSPDWAPRVFALLPLACAVALGDALATFGIAPQLKWPNDVLVDGAKCAGILIEAETSMTARRAVIGFGVNVSHAPADVAATKVGAYAADATADTVFAALRPALGEIFAALTAPDGIETIRARWLQRAVGIGLPVVVRYDSNSIEGRFLGLDEDGRLILEQEGGTRTISAGDVFVRTERL
ncbi:biotin--[acetyl-CoA-carboxylase] ligase [Acuticoccus sp. MNP-M23]|uniref:biotin--[acetyl-CoA-carboxylase] ligase n=1 Tax=Acuticoccus sp. MNP-M23 TaxID=3072793 RepID=UPI0028165779|nr:biotin--[acetyl-CoA-carboxylase] ligase [Acuticoccus sp. MNP-M23]WMS42325.1 biotin--[acetyl-CoA-carboxylase] ligase [Acuticoccus sp. MNP-M23]